MREPEIRCYPSGRKVHLLRPQPSQIDARDIAHHLSLLPRYLGGSEKPYNNAQHSWFVSVNALPEFALAALLHDAAEAYTGDLPGQFKHLPEMAFYRDVQYGLTNVIMKKFGVDWREDVDQYTHRLEKKLFVWEEFIAGRDLLPEREYHPYMSSLWNSKTAEAKFLARFNVLYKAPTESEFA